MDHRLQPGDFNAGAAAHFRFSGLAHVTLERKDPHLIQLGERIAGDDQVVAPPGLEVLTEFLQRYGMAGSDLTLELILDGLNDAFNETTRRWIAGAADGASGSWAARRPA